MKAQDSFGEWLKQRCEENHISLRQAGEKAGLSHSTIHTIIKGGHASAETVTKLAHAFGGGGNQRIALEDKLFRLAGYRSKQEHLSEAMAELMDIVKDFSELKIRVVIEFATYLKEK